MEQEISFISQDEYKISQDVLQLKHWRTKQQKLSFHSLSQFINTNDDLYLESYQDYYTNKNNNNDVYNFNALESFPTDESTESEQSEVLIVSTQQTNNDITQQENIQINIDNHIQIASQQLQQPYQEQQEKKVKIDTEQNQQKNQDQPNVHKSIYKPKKQMLRQQMKEFEVEPDQQGLTYYQRKKIFIQKMKEGDFLLDWDSFKKEDLIYEQTSIGGAQRKKKNKLNQIDIIELPHPSNYKNYNFTSKEAKSYRKISRAQRYEQKALDLKANREEEDYSEEESETQLYKTPVSKERKERKDLKTPQYKQFQQIELISVDEEELIKRRQEFLHKSFLKQKYVDPHHNYIAKQAQAIIPQIMPINEGNQIQIKEYMGPQRFRLITCLQKLKRMQNLNTLKIIQKHIMPINLVQQLEEYMNKFFGIRKPEQVFNILKLNKHNIKNSIDYCNINNDFLKSYFQNKDNEAKKKVYKRKPERKNYV